MKPSIEALEVLAITDGSVFEAVLSNIGLHVEGVVDTDPLRSQVQNEQVVAIASELTEDANTFNVPHDLRHVKKLAEKYGYIVAYA